MAINAAIGAYYYLRLVALMFLEPTTRTDVKPVRVAWAPWLAGVCLRDRYHRDFLLAPMAVGQHSLSGIAVRMPV